MRGHSGLVSLGVAFSGIGEAAYDLVEAFCGTETCWASANDEDVDRAAQCQSEVRMRSAGR